MGQICVFYDFCRHLKDTTEGNCTLPNAKYSNFINTYTRERNHSLTSYCTFLKTKISAALMRLNCRGSSSHAVTFVFIFIPIYNFITSGYDQILMSNLGNVDFGQRNRLLWLIFGDIQDDRGTLIFSLSPKIIGEDQSQDALFITQPSLLCNLSLLPA